MALPPKVSMNDYHDTWIEECDGEDTELARAAFYQFLSRDEDTLMVPFYDMHNHSNDPKKLNTISSKPKRKGNPFFPRSIRDIAPGRTNHNILQSMQLMPVREGVQGLYILQSLRDKSNV